MKVLLITREYPPYEKGGICRIAEYLAKHSGRHGVNLTIIANHPGFGITKSIVGSTIIYRVPSLGSTFLTQLPSFGFFASRLVEKIQDDFDIVYSNFSTVFGKIRKPFVAQFHATRLGESIACGEMKKPVHELLNRLYIPFDRVPIKKADGIIALTEKMAYEVIALGGDKKKIEVIPSGVDTQAFMPLHRRRFDSTQKRILFVGRLDARKGLDILFYAFKEVAKNVRAKLIIGGDGMERKNLLKLAKLLSIQVQFLGPIPHNQVLRLYNEADLFVLPSLYEGMPLVALEAMACGTPTIVSDASPDIGIPRFKRGDVESLKSILLKTLTSEEKLLALSQKSFEISQSYSWERIVDDTYSFLRSFT